MFETGHGGAHNDGNCCSRSRDRTELFDRVRVVSDDRKFDGAASVRAALDRSGSGPVRARRASRYVRNRNTRAGEYRYDLRVSRCSCGYARDRYEKAWVAARIDTIDDTNRYTKITISIEVPRRVEHATNRKLRSRLWSAIGKMLNVSKLGSQKCIRTCYYGEVLRKTLFTKLLYTSPSREPRFKIVYGCPHRPR